MWEDLRSPEYKAKMEREWKVREKARKKAEDKASEVAAAIWTSPAPWRPIEDCPLATLCNTYKADTILVCDTTNVAVVRVRKRFGTPIEWVEEPRMAITDHGMAYIGGKSRTPDWPKWRLKYEFEDVLSHESEMYGKDNIDFVPTHWLPLPRAHSAPNAESGDQG